MSDDDSTCHLQNCDTCRWWDTTEFPDEKGRVPIGYCRRLSPTMVNGSTKYLALANCCPWDDRSEQAIDYDDINAAIWPVTRNWDYCGEWTPSENNSSDS